MPIQNNINNLSTEELTTYEIDNKVACISMWNKENNKDT